MTSERRDARIRRWRAAAIGGGGRRRAWAVRRLVGSTGPRAARALGEVLVHLVAQDQADVGDVQLRHTVESAIRVLTDQDAIDAVCEVAAGSDDPDLRGLLVDAGHEPSNPARRAVWLLLTGQFDRCAALDFDGALLRAAYRDADVSLRRCIAELSRAAGRVEWVRRAAEDPRKGRSGGLDEEQWQTALQVLGDAARGEELWRLVPQAPLRWAVQILVELGAHGWRPRDATDGAAFDGLLPLARSCRAPLSAQTMFEEPRMLDVGGRVLAISPDGDLALFSMPAHGQENAQVQRGVGLWRLSTGEIVWQDPHLSIRSPISSATFSADGELLAVHRVNEIARREAILLWSTRDMSLAGVLELPDHHILGDIALTSDGTVVASVGTFAMMRWKSLVFVWEAGERSGPTHVVRAPLQTGQFDHGLLAVDPRGRTLAVAFPSDVDSDDMGPPHDRLVLWTMPPTAPPSLLHESPHIRKVTTSPDGSLLVCSGRGGHRLWRLPSGAPAGFLDPEEPTDEMTMSADGRLLVDRSRVWRSADLRPVARFAPPAGFRAPRPGTASPDGALVVTELWSDPHRSPPRISAWHLPDGTYAGHLRPAPTDRDPLRSLSITADGAVVAVHRNFATRHPGIYDLIARWSPRPALTGSLPVGAVTPPEVHALRTTLAGCPAGDRSWLDVLDALVTWRHRHDIAVSATDPDHAPAATDIAIDR